MPVVLRNGPDRIVLKHPRSRLGRSPQCEHVIPGGPDSVVSWEHVCVEVTNGLVVVSDLGSTNGTYVNGAKLEPQRRIAVTLGDRIRFGQKGPELVVESINLAPVAPVVLVPPPVAPPPPPPPPEPEFVRQEVIPRADPVPTARRPVPSTAQARRASGPTNTQLHREVEHLHGQGRTVMLVAVVGVAVCLLAVGLVIGISYLNKPQPVASEPSTTPTAPTPDTKPAPTEKQPSKSGVIERLSDLPVSDQTRLRAETVALVVAGWDIRKTNSDWWEIPMSSGSGFVISASGKILTNKHVVESYVEEKRNLEGKGPPATWKQKYGVTAITPKLWVFFGRDEKHECEVEYVSESYDLAVLNPRRPAKRFLALCDTPDADIPQLRGLTALGFPGNDRKARKWLEGNQNPTLADPKGPKEDPLEKLFKRPERPPGIRHAFDDPDFKLSVDTGDVRKTPTELKLRGGTPTFYLQHSASTAHGNSGGPLLATDGTVVGINTIIRPVEVTDTEGNVVVISQGGQNYALTLRQMKKEIDRHVPDAVWRKHPE